MTANGKISINPLQNDKILDQSTLTVFVYDKLILSQMMNFVLGKAEKIVGKGENAGYPHFLLFPQFLLRAFFKSLDCVVKGSLKNCC